MEKPSFRNTKNKKRMEFMERYQKNTLPGIADEELPLGFGMALAQNDLALKKFGKMDERQRQRFLFDARHARSREEMQSVVNRIGEWQ